MVVDGLRYTKDHEWVKAEGDVVTMGITDHAQEQLGELVFVELPEAGNEYAARKEIAVVESSKAAGDVYCPVAGTVTVSHHQIVELFRVGEEVRRRMPVFRGQPQKTFDRAVLQQFGNFFFDLL